MRGARTTRRRGGAGQSRRLGSGDGLWKACDLVRRAASASVASGADAEGARVGAASQHDVAARGTGRHEFVLLIPCLSTNNSQFLNKSVPTDEYESCRLSVRNMVPTLTSR
jgi:hypothetical protein